MYVCVQEGAGPHLQQCNAATPEKEKRIRTYHPSYLPDTIRTPLPHPPGPGWGSSN